MSARASESVVRRLREAATERSEGGLVSERSERANVAALREAATERSEGGR
jgi:hypothetical protein